MSDQDDLPSQLRDIPRDQLKHGTGRFSGIILVPQPSSKLLLLALGLYADHTLDSPNDPLNVRKCPLGTTEHVLMSCSGRNGRKNQYC